MHEVEKQDQPVPLLRCEWCDKDIEGPPTKGTCGENYCDAGCRRLRAISFGEDE